MAASNDKKWHGQPAQPHGQPARELGRSDLRGMGGPPMFWSEAIFNSYHGHLARAGQ